MIGDTISRQAAIEAVMNHYRVGDKSQNEEMDWCARMLSGLPSADLSEYCDKLWKAAYERGKAEAIDALPTAEKKGKWINHRNDEGHNIADCDQCGEAMQWFDDDLKPNYCPNCGADMRGDKDD